MQLLRRKFLALLEIQFHQFLVNFDHLIDDLCVRFLDGAERGFVALRLEEAVDDTVTVRCRQVHRQAFLTERILNFIEYLFEVNAFCIDLVHDDHAAHAAIVRCGSEYRQGATKEVAVSRGVYQVNVYTVVIEVADRVGLRMTDFLFAVRVIGNGGAFFYRAFFRNFSACVQQRFGE